MCFYDFFKFLKSIMNLNLEALGLKYKYLIEGRKVWSSKILCMNYNGKQYCFLQSNINSRIVVFRKKTFWHFRKDLRSNQSKSLIRYHRVLVRLLQTLRYDGLKCLVNTLRNNYAMSQILPPRKSTFTFFIAQFVKYKNLSCLLRTCLI